tara:strand:+ start:95641 stop:96555 length:915 start_codon:yes stop_codon:yes gene_type:complete
MTNKLNKRTDVGVIVARFQLPFLHAAYADIIKEVCNNHDDVIIMLGLSPLFSTFDNPLDLKTREQMIWETFPDVTIGWVKDVPDDENWSDQLDYNIGARIAPNQSVTLYGSYDSVIRKYTGGYTVVELEPERHVSVKQLRKDFVKKPKYDQSFRVGVISATQKRYPAVIPTVDVAIVDRSNNKCRILLGKRKSEKKFRFFGGFADPHNNGFEEDAIREVHEETGLTIKEVDYIGSYKIDDWRYRTEQDKIVTTLFVGKYIDGTPEPSDDMDGEVRWFNANELNDTIFVDEHKELFHALITKLYN